MPANPNEIFPVVDTDGRVMGKASRRECHNGSKILHPVVHLQLFNSRGDLYLQKRALHKDIQPGKWDTAVGGHIDYGESVENALRREAREELRFTIYDGNIIPDNDEVECGRFWSIREIEASLNKDIFTPNFENEYQSILHRLLVSR